MRKVLLQGRCRGGLYPWLSLESSSLNYVFLATKPSVIRWHDRLDHPSMRVLYRIVRENSLPCTSLEYNKESVCDACQQGKTHQLTFPKSTSVSMVPLELVHYNVWGPTPT
jgi:hypothetical protein